MRRGFCEPPIPRHRCIKNDYAKRKWSPTSQHMPLSCKSGADFISAINYNATQWDELRVLNSTEKLLRLDCCGSMVTLKTSKLGTRFFAHKQRGECTSARETAEHLFVKERIAQAILGSDWRVATEVRGNAPDGSVWIADVMAERGKHRIAFEVQWEPQSQALSTQRQERYRHSGVRGLWLFRHPSGIQLSQDVPSLLIEIDHETTAWVRIPAEVSLHLTDHQARKSDYLWSQKIELGRFVRGCLARKFVWSPGLNERVPLDIWSAEQNCWKCGGKTSIITRLDFRIDRLLPNAKSITLGLDDFDTPAGIAVLSDALLHTNLKAHGIGAVRSRFSKTRGSAYLSNGCVHCDALQGAFFEHEVWYEAEPTLTIECLMSEALFTEHSHENPHRWAFDESFEAP